MKTNNINLTTELAEFVGIMLGDGNVNFKTNQITISCGIIDGTYITEYIPFLITKLFSKRTGFRKQNRGGFDCRFSSKEACNFLIKDMKITSPKINCKIPYQFFKSKILLKFCVRGLFDTDGGLHRHHQKSAQLKFTNKSFSLIQSLYLALKQLGYKPCTTIDHKEKNTFAIYLFSNDVKKYFNEVGSSNPKNQIKFKQWIEAGVVPLNSEIEKNVRLTREVQEKILNKNLDSLKIFGFGAES